MENPGIQEVINALNILLEVDILTDVERSFINECKECKNPVEYLQKSLDDYYPVAISIYQKLEKFYNDTEEKNK